MFCRVQVKEFVSYDDRNFYMPGVSYTNADTKVSETLDVIFKVVAAPSLARALPLPTRSLTCRLSSHDDRSRGLLRVSKHCQQAVTCIKRTGAQWRGIRQRGADPCSQHGASLPEGARRNGAGAATSQARFSRAPLTHQHASCLTCLRANVTSSIESWDEGGNSD